MKKLSLLFLLSLSACAHRMELPMVENPQTEIKLALKSEKGVEDITRYYSHSYIRDYEGPQLVRERDEIVDFRVLEKIMGVNKKGEITVLTSTTTKDGTVDLHDLAFPEKGEEIEYIFNRDGKVLKAGDLPPDSIFYVPPLALPKGPVKVGDTWALDHAWISLKNGIPLAVHLVAILKSIRQCGKGLCADIELSGSVELVGLKKEAIFNSSIWGRMLMSVEKGSVLWSEVRSRERMTLSGKGTDVLSCLVSGLEAPADLQILKVKPVCKPTQDPVKPIY